MTAYLPLGCGCSSGVEHNLAKVGVEGSNPFARSKFLDLIEGSHLIEPNTAVTVSAANESRPAPAEQGAFVFVLLSTLGSESFAF
jgi:hypothetical protein